MPALPCRSANDRKPAASSIVDVQQGFDDPAWGPRNNPACEANIARLLEACARSGLPVVLVRHDSDRAGLAAPAGDTRQRLQGRRRRPRARRPRQQAASTPPSTATPDLDAWLRERDIDALVICGITTNHCCETTARIGRQPRLRRAASRSTRRTRSTAGPRRPGGCADDLPRDGRQPARRVRDGGGDADLLDRLPRSPAADPRRRPARVTPPSPNRRSPRGTEGPAGRGRRTGQCEAAEVRVQGLRRPTGRWAASRLRACLLGQQQTSRADFFHNPVARPLHQRKIRPYSGSGACSSSARSRDGDHPRGGEAMSVTPSAVAQQLRILEDEAGMPLLEPHGRLVRLRRRHDARRARRCRSPGPVHCGVGARGAAGRGHRHPADRRLPDGGAGVLPTVIAASGRPTRTCDPPA